jgi:GSH-dependent disulfide-bond oxidoreductase
MAIWPWASLWERQGQDIAEFPHMAAWLDRVGSRPAVQAGRAVAARTARKNVAVGHSTRRSILFGQRARH